MVVEYLVRFTTNLNKTECTSIYLNTYVDDPISYLPFLNAITNTVTLSTEPRMYDCSVIDLAPKSGSCKCSLMKETDSSFENVSHRPSLARIRKGGLREK